MPKKTIVHNVRSRGQLIFKLSVYLIICDEDLKKTLLDGMN